MGKGKRNKAKHRSELQAFLSESLTRHMREELRNSEFWPKMVAEFGEEEAERLLNECKGQWRLPSDDESGDRPADL